MKQFMLILCLFQLIAVSLPAQNAKKIVQAGIELDALPFATGGYFGAAWVGKEHIRVRLLTAKVNMPEFITRSGFSQHQITSYAVTADYFLKENWNGWWAAAGFVYWKSSIRTDAQLQTARFKNYLLNGSIGYNIRLHKQIYLSPWAGMSIRTGGDKAVAVDVDAKKYTLPLINPEASLKIGFRF